MYHRTVQFTPAQRKVSQGMPVQPFGNFYAMNNGQRVSFRFQFFILKKKHSRSRIVS